MNMKKSTVHILWIISLFMLFILQSSQVQAGQVVTKSDKEWAQQVLEQEKYREPVYSPNTVAVLSFRNTTGKDTLDPLQKGLAFLLMTDLSQLEKIQLVERVKLQALVEELNLGTSGLVSEDYAPRVGRLLGASYLVGGDILPAQATDLQVKSSLLEVKDANVLGQPEARGKLEEIFGMEKKILFELIDLLKIALTAEQRSKLEKPFTTNLDAFLNFINGIESSDRGNYSDAASYYQRAINKDPHMQPAWDALSELESLGLVTYTNRSQIMLRNLEKSTSTTDSPTHNVITQVSGNPAVIEQNVRESGDVKVKW
jgi:TolB-like protein